MSRIPNDRTLKLLVEGGQKYVKLGHTPSCPEAAELIDALVEMDAEREAYLRADTLRLRSNKGKKR